MNIWTILVSALVSLFVSTITFKKNFKYQKYYDKLSADLYELQGILGKLNFYIEQLHNLVEGQEEDAYSLEAKQYKDFLEERERLVLFLKAKPFVLNRLLWENIQKFNASELGLLQLWWSNRGDMSGGYKKIKNLEGLGHDITIPSEPFNYNLISETELSKRLEKFMIDIEKIVNEKNRLFKFCIILYNRTRKNVQ